MWLEALWPDTVGEDAGACAEADNFPKTAIFVTLTHPEKNPLLANNGPAA